MNTPVTEFPPSHADRAAAHSRLQRVVYLLGESHAWGARGRPHLVRECVRAAIETARLLDAADQQRLSGFSLRAADLPQGESRHHFWADLLVQLEKEQS